MKYGRMNGANVELTQAVSQMTGPTAVSLADDLLQTQRMTMIIDGLIESTEVNHAILIKNEFKYELSDY
jgi:hypothetical protein